MKSILILDNYPKKDIQVVIDVPQRIVDINKRTSILFDEMEKSESESRSDYELKGNKWHKPYSEMLKWYSTRGNESFDKVNIWEVDEENPNYSEVYLEHCINEKDLLHVMRLYSED